MKITKRKTIHLENNITLEAFYNNKPSHAIYDFAVGVVPSFTIDETPQHLLYLSILGRCEIHYNPLTYQVLKRRIYGKIRTEVIDIMLPILSNKGNL